MASDLLMVFCYDVAADSARRKVAELLEREAVRVQRSVFEARMSPARADRLVRRAVCHLAEGDSLRIYAVGAHGLRHSRAYGGLPIAESEDFYLL